MSNELSSLPCPALQQITEFLTTGELRNIKVSSKELAHEIKKVLSPIALFYWDLPYQLTPSSVADANTNYECIYYKNKHQASYALDLFNKIFGLNDNRNDSFIPKICITYDGDYYISTGAIIKRSLYIKTIPTIQHVYRIFDQLNPLPIWQIPEEVKTSEPTQISTLTRAQTQLRKKRIWVRMEI
jgi:hypothetical protein